MKKKHYVLIIALFFLGLPAYAQDKPLIVAELFTSKNCPSCPPAEEILKSLAVQDNIIPLACHVRYQDDGRRPDPFAQDFCDTRQHGYVAQSGEKKIYTPQMFINGGTGFVGSRRAELNDAMQWAYNNPIETITLEYQNGSVSFTTNKLPQSPDLSYNLWAFGYKKSEGTPVITLINIGKWDGAPISQMITKPAEDIDALVVIIQEKGYGRIVGAGKVDF